MMRSTEKTMKTNDLDVRNYNEDRNDLMRQWMNEHGQKSNSDMFFDTFGFRFEERWIPSYDVAIWLISPYENRDK